MSSHLNFPDMQQRLVVTGSAVVFLLAIASLANALLGHQPMPELFQQAAVVTHLATVLAALPLGVSQVLLRKGGARHRIIGYIWLALMVTTAIVSFAIHSINPKGLSPIHIFSVMTLISAPLILCYARTHQVERHRNTALGVIVGGLVVAGAFTFMPERALGQLLFGLLGLR